VTSTSTVPEKKTPAPRFLRSLRAGRHFNRGQLLAAREEWEAAASEYEQALGLCPDWAHVFLHYALLLGEQDRLAEALERMQQALALRPESPVYHTFHGWLLAQAGEEEEARRALERARATTPSNKLTLNGLVYVSLRQGRVQEALSRLQEHGLCSNLNMQARLLVELERKVREGALALNPMEGGLEGGTVGRAWRWLEEQGDRWRERLASWRDRWRSEDSRTRRQAYRCFRRGRSRLEKGQNRLALEDLERARSLFRLPPPLEGGGRGGTDSRAGARRQRRRQKVLWELRMYLGGAYFELLDFESARRTLEAAQQLRREFLPAEPEATEDPLTLLLGATYLRLGHTEAARACLAAAMESPETHYYRALLALADGEEREARREFRLALQADEALLERQLRERRWK